MNKSSDETSIDAPMYQRIRTRLEQNFAAHYMDLTNESHMHNVPANSETHFKLVLVSEDFAGRRPVQRHQAVYKVLEAEMQNGVHALALHLYTPEEWAQKAGAPDSPQCLGGGKH